MSETTYHNIYGYEIAQVEPGIFHVRVPEDSVLEEGVIRKLFNYYSEQCEGNYGIISEFQAIDLDLSQQIKAFASQGELPERYVARAVIVNTLAHRIEIKNFILRYTPKTPTEIVANLQEGIAFIKKHIRS